MHRLLNKLQNQIEAKLRENSKIAAGTTLQQQIQQTLQTDCNSILQQQIPTQSAATTARREEFGQHTAASKAVDKSVPRNQNNAPVNGQPNLRQITTGGSRQEPFTSQEHPQCQEYTTASQTVADCHNTATSETVAEIERRNQQAQFQKLQEEQLPHHKPTLYDPATGGDKGISGADHRLGRKPPQPCTDTNIATITTQPSLAEVQEIHTLR